MSKLATDISSASGARAAFLGEFFRRLETAGVRYAVARGHLTSVTEDEKDVDILAMPSDFARIISMHRALAKERGGWNVVAYADNKNLYLKSLFASHENAADSVSALYLHVMGFSTAKTSARARSSKGAGVRVWIDQVACEKTMVHGVEMMVPTPKFRVLFLISRLVQRKRQRYLDGIRHIVSEHGLEDWASGIGGLLLPDAAGQDIDGIPDRELFAALDGALRSLSANSDRVRMSEWLSLMRENVRSLFRKRGFLAFFSGPDGAGKTTTSDALADVIGRKLKIRVRRMKHLYPVSNALSRNAMKLQAQIRGMDVADKHGLERDRGTSWRWKLRRLVGLLYAVVQMPLGYAYARYLCFRGNAVIVDTSFFDVFVKGHRPAFPLLTRVVVPLIPVGDAWFLMRADPAAIVARKPELSESEIASYYDFMQRMSRQSGRAATDVPSSLSVANSLAQIVRSMAHAARR